MQTDIQVKCYFNSDSIACFRYMEEVSARSPPPPPPPAFDPNDNRDNHGLPQPASRPHPPPPPPAPDLHLADALIRCHEEALLRAEVLAPGEEQLAACARRLFLGEVGAAALGSIKDSWSLWPAGGKGASDSWIVLWRSSMLYGMA